MLAFSGWLLATPSKLLGKQYTHSFSLFQSFPLSSFLGHGLIQTSEWLKLTTFWAVYLVQRKITHFDILKDKIAVWPPADLSFSLRCHLQLLKPLLISMFIYAPATREDNVQFLQQLFLCTPSEWEHDLDIQILQFRKFPSRECNASLLLQACWICTKKPSSNSSLKGNF